MLPELTVQEWAAALDVTAAELLARLPLPAPPVDALRLAEVLGLDVAWDDRQQGRGRIARLAVAGGSGSILLRPDPRRERLQWAIAHEIGEFCAHRAFAQLGIDPREAPPGTREAVANQLASRLLLPRDWFADDGRRTGWDLFELKARYATASHELVARRMLDFEPAVVITIFDHGRRTFRRGNLPFRLPPLSEPEHAAWVDAHGSGTLAEQTDYAWHVRAWPVHEPGWKREILRAQWCGE
jgi:hypothetical protein